MSKRFRHKKLLFPVFATLVAGLFPCRARGDEPPASAAPAAVTFEDDVVPILQARCFRCHGNEARKGGLDLRRKFTIEQGGDGGPAIVAGKPGESLLIEMIEDKQMPPKDEDPLDARQIEVLRRWIAQGAAIRGKSEPPLETGDSEAEVSDEDRRFWSFQPPVRPAVPAVRDMARVRTPIDAFVLAQLEAQGLSMNPEASKLTLLRRICFDLTGLPPTVEQIDAFLADERDDAYERLVTSLLDSPQYGERWARHWLDVAGYADSDGGLDADRERPEAWRYRDYVIRSLNSDKRYDQFVREQLAGDELSDWRQAAELSPEMIDQLVATGFLRTAADPTYTGYKEKPEIHKVLADTMQIVGSAFLGVTLQCARCHEHKLEPISQRDYYQVQAVFDSALHPDRWLSSNERVVPLATDAQLAKMNAWNAAVAERQKTLEAEVAAVMAEHRERLLAEKLAAVPAEVKDAVKAALLVSADKRNEEQKALIATHAATVVVDDNALYARFEPLKPQVERLNAALAAEKALVRSVPALRGVADLEGETPATHLLRRGDFNNRGRAVEPAVPAVFAPKDFRLAARAGHKTSGRRRAFAEWLVDPRHPTTARLQMNRLWAGHFGRGLVETLDDFGHSGKLPSHPELLDWLATEFVASGWSMKAMHRLIVLSTVYRQSGAFNEAAAEKDPENRLFWCRRPLRHQGETLRDAVLSAAGMINGQMFGPPVPVALQPDGSVVTADDGPGRRRSIYLQVRRSQPLTLMEAFDTPRMEVNCTRRSEAVVPTQALTLLNSPFMDACARAVAGRVASHSADRHARIDFAWKLLYSRPASDSERQSLVAFLDRAVAPASEAGASGPATPALTEDAAWQHAALILLNSNEFLFVD